MKLVNFLSYTVTNREIRTEKSTGGHIRGTIEEAMQISRMHLGLPVSLVFNDIYITVDANTNINACVDNYMSKFNQTA